MGRFSWGKARAKSRKETSSSVVVEDTDEGEQGKGDSAVLASSSSSPSSATSGCVSFKFLWVLALCAAAIFGYCMEATPGRFSNAMFSNHLFSEYKAPRRLHMNLLHSRRSSLSTTLVDPVSLWSSPSDNGWKPCLNQSIAAASGPANGYLQVMCSGGLFQIHICVCEPYLMLLIVN